MALAIATISIIALVLLLQAWKKITKSKKKLPPGPYGFPIFGHFHLLRKSPHRALHQLAKRYGPIMHIRLGQVPVIVVSSPQSAESFLKTHDVAFANRPMIAANISGSSYGSYWRNIRKMCTTQLLSHHKIDSFRFMRKDELNMFVDCIKEASYRGIAVDLKVKVASLTADMSCRMVFGKKCGEKEFNERGFMVVLKEFMQVLSTSNMGDYFPVIAPYDLQGVIKKIDPISKVFDGLLEKIIKEHKEFQDVNRTQDFVDIMLEFLGSEESEYCIGRDNIKAIMLDMIIGSMDTTATTIDWTLSEITRHPRVMKKIQKELEEKVGLGRILEESDLINLKYLDMVIKETLRLHPVAPLLVPHKAGQDTIVDGFFISKGSQILINAWAIGRDPDAWSDAEKFWPERFIGKDIEIQGRNFELLPFGSGRRGCPGLHLAMTVLPLVVAQLLHCFDWKLPNDLSPADLDMTEKVGMVTIREKHLQVIPSYRLQV